jgi:hypothetical protein
MVLFLFLAGSPNLGAAPIKVKVTAELANIRLKPSISSVIIRQIAQGEILEAVRKEGEWYLVKIEPDESGNASGYVHESLVLPLEEITQTGRKTQVAEPVVKQADERPRRTEAAVRETPAAPSGEGTASAWSFTISAGGNYAVGGDLNKGAQGLADYLGAQLTAASKTTVAPARVSFMFGGEATIPLSSWLQIAFGADYYSSSKNSLVSYLPSETTPTFAAKPRFQAIPVSAALKLHPVKSFYLKLGVAFFLANCGYYCRYENDLFWQEWKGDAKAQGFGYFGGLGYDWAVSESIALVFEAIGQYAPIKGFSGTGTYQDSTLNDPISEDGKLYAYNAALKGRSAVPLIIIRSQKPAEAYVENAREATIDFSGLSLRLGVKIKL